MKNIHTILYFSLLFTIVFVVMVVFQVASLKSQHSLTAILETVTSDNQFYSFASQIPIPFIDVASATQVKQQAFTTAGSYTYTPTPGTTRIIVQIWGAGGAGGSCGTITRCSAAGGSSGDYEEYYSTVPTPGSLIVGAGGMPVAGGNGNAGGQSTLLQGTTALTASGGAGGVITTKTINVPPWATGFIGQNNSTALGGRGQDGKVLIWEFIE